MATRWCLICGAEYIDTVEVCPECDVPLVDEPPNQDLSDIGSGQVAYDLAEWSNESRVMLEQLLESEEIRHAWEGTTLVVPDIAELRVDNLVEHVEVTTLPTLDPDADRIAYDVSDWNDAMIHELQLILDRSHVPYEFDADGDIVTTAEHQERVESLMDSIESAGGEGEGAASRAIDVSETSEDELDEEEDEYDEDEDEDNPDYVDAGQVLSDLFISADRLKKSARDHDGVLTFMSAAERCDRMSIPYGFSRVVWKDIVNQVANVRELLEDDGSKDEDIEQQARDLRDTLRDFV